MTSVPPIQMQGQPVLGGYRDPDDQTKLIVSKQVYSKIPAIKAQSLERTDIWTDLARPMDND